MFHRQSGCDFKVQLRMRLAERCLCLAGFTGAGKEKSKVTGALGPGGDVVMQPGGDFEVGDIGNGFRFLDAFNGSQGATGWDGEHKYGGGL